MKYPIFLVVISFFIACTGTTSTDTVKQPSTTEKTEKKVENTPDSSPPANSDSRGLSPDTSSTFTSNAPPPAGNESKTRQLIAAQRVIKYNSGIRKLDYVIKKQPDVKVPDSNPLKVEGLKTVTQYSYQSKKPIKTNTYKRFYLTMYDYENHESVQQAMEKFQEVASPDWGYSKEYDYLYPYDKTIIWLNGGCMYSKEEWNKLTDRFYQNLDIDESRGYRWMSCNCGKGCKVN